MDKRSDLTPFYKAVLDRDTAPVVLCDLEHTILYMNPAAVARYAKQGGDSLIGKSLLNCHTPKASERINRVLDWFAENPDHNIIY